MRQTEKFGIGLIESKAGNKKHLKIVNAEANPCRGHVIDKTIALKYCAKDTQSTGTIKLGITTDTIDRYTAELLVQCGLKADVLKMKRQFKRTMA